MILIAITMAVIIAVAAFAIDAANWMSRHHQAQVVADSAALAAANCLANPGSTAGTIVIKGVSTPLPACNSGTDTVSAQTVAEDYAKANGIALSNPSQIKFNTTNDTVHIDATATSSSFFASLFGINSTTQSASAQATWTPGSSACSTPGNGCAAVFAMGQSCASSSSAGGSPIIFNGSSDTITGIVHSNGSIWEAGGGGQTLGPTTFGNGSGCAIDWSNESGDTWNGSSIRPTAGEAPITTWPEDYRTTVTPCGSGYSYACTGPYGTPSYCTEAAGTAGYSSANGAGSSSGFDYGSRSEVPINGQVWCAYGSGTPSDPTSWNGTIYFQANSTTVTGNWIGGAIQTGNNGWILSPELTSFPVLYANGAGDCSSGTSGGICMTGGSNQINGSLFAPNGWIEFNGAGTSTQNFLEAQGINFIGGNDVIKGTGPTSLSGGGPGSDSLTQ